MDEFVILFADRWKTSTFFEKKFLNSLSAPQKAKRTSSNSQNVEVESFKLKDQQTEKYKTFSFQKELDRLYKENLELDSFEEVENEDAQKSNETDKNSF